MSPTAVAFDLGGVFFDWDPRHLYRRLIPDPEERERFLGEICTPQWHRAHDLGESTRESCSELARQHPGQAGLIMAWADGVEEMIGGVYEDTVAVLRALKTAGVRCYSLSNMEPETFPARLARFEFMGEFDGHVISGLEKVAKPDPAIFTRLLRRYSLEPAQVVFVDDQPVNVEAAARIGMPTVLFRSAAGLRDRLAALGLLGAGAASGEDPLQARR